MASAAFIRTLVVVCGFLCPLCQAQTQDAEWVLQGVVDARSQLRSGIYHIKGDRHIERGEESERYPLTVKCAFDYEQSLSNFQRCERIPLVRNKAKVEGGVTIELRLIRRPDCAFLYRSGIGPEALTIRDPDVEVESPVMPFDIRVFGLTTFVGGEEAATVKSLAESLTKKHAEKCSKTGDVWEVQWRVRNKGPAVVATLWVDEAKQFAPIKLTYGMEQTQPDGPGSQWGQESVVQWKRVSDVWVPSSARMEHRSSQQTTTYDLEIDWKKVNEELGGQQFEIAAMELPGSTLVSEHRTDEPFVVGRLDELPVKIHPP
ncbi:hypothetical protein [Pirellulimonas nuda]|nr:hypothetical protein [Pirellulimonas nuda]